MLGGVIFLLVINVMWVNAWLSAVSILVVYAVSIVIKDIFSVSDKAAPQERHWIGEKIHQKLSEIGTEIELILNEEAENVQEHVGRIRGLIEDSTLLLQESFKNVVSHTQDQSNIALELVQRLTGEYQGSEEKILIKDFIENFTHPTT